MVDTAVYLFEGEPWSSRRLENLTTDGNGLATFSFSTAALTGDLNLRVRPPLLGWKQLSALELLLHLFLSFTPRLP